MHVVIDVQSELKITMLLDDIESVYKIAPYREDDFLVYFKRKSTGEVLYYLTHERKEIATNPSNDIISALGYNDGQIERSDIVPLRNKFSFVRITANNEEKRSSTGEIGNFNIRFPWISFTSFGGFAYNFINVDEPSSNFRLDLKARKFSYLPTAAVAFVSPFSLLHKHEIHFLEDHQTYLVYHKVLLLETLEIVKFRRHIYLEKRKNVRQLTDSGDAVNSEFPRVYSFQQEHAQIRNVSAVLLQDRLESILS